MVFQPVDSKESRVLREFRVVAHQFCLNWLRKCVKTYVQVVVLDRNQTRGLTFGTEIGPEKQHGIQNPPRFCLTSLCSKWSLDIHQIAKQKKHLEMIWLALCSSP